MTLALSGKSRQRRFWLVVVAIATIAAGAVGALGFARMDRASAIVGNDSFIEVCKEVEDNGDDVVDGGTFYLGISNTTQGQNGVDDVSNATEAFDAFEGSPVCNTFTVPAGDEFAVRETGTPTNWNHSSGYPMVDGQTAGDIAGAPGIEHVSGPLTVTFTNKTDPRPKLTIIKQSFPADGTSFNFNLSSATQAVNGFMLDDDGVNTDEGHRKVFFLDPGTYEVTETFPPGWQQFGTACGGGDITAIDSGLRITLNTGDDLTCYFQNELMFGQIKVIKVLPAGGDPNHLFWGYVIPVTSGGGLGNPTFTDLSANNSVVVSNLSPGRYNVWEIEEDAVDAGYQVLGYALGDGDSCPEAPNNSLIQPEVFSAQTTTVCIYNVPLEDPFMSKTAVGYDTETGLATWEITINNDGPTSWFLVEDEGATLADSNGSFCADISIPTVFGPEGIECYAGADQFTGGAHGHAAGATAVRALRNLQHRPL